MEVENETIKSQLQISSLTSQLKRLQATVQQQQAAMDRQNKFRSQAESEIGHNNALIERKQTEIDQLNKKIAQKMSKMDGVSDNKHCSLHYQHASQYMYTVKYIEYIHVCMSMYHTLTE